MELCKPLGEREGLITNIWGIAFIFYFRQLPGIVKKFLNSFRPYCYIRLLLLLKKTGVTKIFTHELLTTSDCSMPNASFNMSCDWILGHLLTRTNMNLVGQISRLKPKPKLKSKQQHTDNTTWPKRLWMKAIRSPSYVSQKPKPYFRYTPLLTASRSKFVHHTFCTSRIYKNAVNHFVSLAYEELFTLLLKQWCNCQCSADTNI